MPGKNGQKLIRGAISFGGRRYYVSGYTAEEVEFKKAEKLRSLEEGELDPKKMTVRQWAKEWLKRYKEGKVNDRWLKDIENNLDKWVLNRIGAFQIRKVRQYHIQEIMDQLEGKSQSLIDKTYDQICSIFYKAWINGYIKRNPAVDIIMPRSAATKKRRSVTEEERTLILEIAEDFKGSMLFLIMLYAGLRPSEAAALRWKNVDLERDVIHVHEMLKSDGSIKSYGKTDYAIRNVWISNILKRKLLEYIGDTIPNGDDFVVPQRNSEDHQTRNSMRKLWLDFRKEMHKRLGGETTNTIKTYTKQESGREYNRQVEEIIDDRVASDLVPYCLRHTFCTDLKAAGIPVEVAKDLMGHSSITITADIYSHAEEKSFNDSREKMNALNNNRNRDIS